MLSDTCKWHIKKKKKNPQQRIVSSDILKFATFTRLFCHFDWIYIYAICRAESKDCDRFDLI